jgi:hypothetical protein
MAAPRNRPHIFLSAPPEAEPFRPYSHPVRARAFERPTDRVAHAERLTEALATARTEGDERRETAAIRVEGAEPGVYIQFDAPRGVDLKLESLEAARRGIVLAAVQRRPVQDGASFMESATVFVPAGKMEHFFKRLNEYATETTEKGEPKNKDLVDRIASIRLATLRAFWTDALDAFPAEDQAIWWEVWLRRRDGHEMDRFVTFAAEAQIRVGVRRLAFDDRVVCLAHASPHQLSGCLDGLGDLAELRHARTSASFFLDLSTPEQGEWVVDLLGRTTGPPPDAPAVCVLDTGVNRGHPLLEAALAAEDATAVDPSWGSHDNGGGPTCAGHGTEMAGLGLYGDLFRVLESADPVRLRHRLESVKILPPIGANDPDLYGAITAEAVTRPEVQAPQRHRVFSMAVTAAGANATGQPTSWSAAVDALAAGRSFDQSTGGLVYLDAAETEGHRLFVVSAGNVAADMLAVEHLDRSDLEPVQDPAQAWNALTVGACTEKAVIQNVAYQAWLPVAAPGELSPWSTTSRVFDQAWPNKPDVVFEGGNVAHDGAGNFDGGLADLCLLSTHYLPTATPFVLSNATSAATAQVARIGAMIAAEYPGAWPETVRALIAHSARWTTPMQAAIDGASRRAARSAIFRRYGLGVPDLSSALRSANDALTLVAQATIRPFDAGTMREMHVHQLPWPAEVLDSLAERMVRLRVTLSYFIEPNPARLGWRRRHRYASHLLRFDVKKADESLADFRKRLNQRALAEDEGKPTSGSDSPEWLLGDRTRNRGSLHSDIWSGTAADLASRGAIGIYPVSGWWKEQPKRDRSSLGARYSLVVSIETDEEGVDIWTPVAVQVGVPVENVPIEI